MFQTDAGLVTAILRCFGGNLTASRESNCNLTPRDCGLHADVLVEVTVAVVLEKCDEPILVFLEAERQLLREHAHHVQCGRLLVQTVGADVHALLLSVLVFLFHQVVLALLRVLVFLVVNDDVINLR